MTRPLSVVVASYGSEQFALLDRIVRQCGHTPVAYVLSRSMRPATPSEEEFITSLSEIVKAIPNGMDLLLPGRAIGLEKQLSGYAPDLMVVLGFNWRIPAEVLALPRLGILNIHPSILPRYRGPSPVPWAIRNGDQHFGLTVHRMNDDMDSGPVMSRSDLIPIPDRPTHEEIWNRIASALPNVLTESIRLAIAGANGEPQESELATYASLPTAEWFVIDLADSRVRIYHQIRAIDFLRPGEGVVVEAGNRRIRVRQASLAEIPGGLAVPCADGTLWLADWEYA